MKLSPFLLKHILLLTLVFVCVSCAASNPTITQSSEELTLTVATFNVSMEARNYVDENTAQNDLARGQLLLIEKLATGTHPQIKNIAEIIQRTSPDIILLNEFDFIDNPAQGIQAFVKNYLNVSQNGARPIDYPYYFVAPSNTGLPTVFDLNNDGKADRFANDAQGFGLYPGHYGMALLSKYPIQQDQIRTFQRFLWSDMPNAKQPIVPETNLSFYDKYEWANLRLSSKSHWDVPINVAGQTIHILASHPTPPVFDGKEDRNGKRNNDEIRFWVDYISPDKGSYIYDDSGEYGGIAPNSHFVIAGDLNASPDRVNIDNHAILTLTTSPLINNSFIPSSDAGLANKPDNEYARYHTARWAARVDYVLPSARLKINDGGIFWPQSNEENFSLIQDRASSSDHYLVWLTLSLPKAN